MQIGVLIRKAAQTLGEAGIVEANLDARLLFQHLASLSASQVVLHATDPADEQVTVAYQRLVEERARRVPLHYLIGTREFWSMDFVVSPAVLIPRPETEFLLEQVLALCRTDGPVRRGLDLCTGSGVIAVVLAKELGCSLTAVDISSPALAVALGNITRHGVAAQVDLVCGDLFTPLATSRPFDLIVSNPPYVADDQIDGLEFEVSRAEPRLALAGGPDGLEVIGRLAAGAVHHLRPGGWLFIEIGADQRKAVLQLFQARGAHYDQIQVIDDWAGRPRVLQARHRPAA
ncbi:MAG: peptide chain release factor N(5)-glutamine methyltransferase [Desulfobulbus sp.]|jgi:release factor glutamine methyltransferase|nr:peptide chain release factor N(5)-glutamine methyltransferase [Desulfobulbus sp.]